jgi:isoleucyl-tRNA synthetase
MLSDYSEDIRIGKDTLKLTGDLYRRIRNTFRYLLGALDGFTEEERVTDYAKMPELERLVLHWLFELDGEIREHVKNYEFGKLAHRLHNFCTNELSAFYFDIRKDSLYCDRPDSDKRRACRTILAHLFDCLTAWLAPILAFTAEEAWEHRPSGLGKENSVHLRAFPVIPASWKNSELEDKWQKINYVRTLVLAALELKRQDKFVGSSLEGNAVITVKKGYAEILKGVDIAEICIVSGAEMNQNDESKFTKQDTEEYARELVHSVKNVEIKKAEGTKCSRCWKILPEVGSDKEHKDVCLRCADAVRHHEKIRKAA